MPGDQAESAWPGPPGCRRQLQQHGAGAAEPGVCAGTPGAVVGEVAVPTTPTPVAGAESRRTEDAGAHTEGPGAGDDELVAGAEEPGVQAPPTS